MNNERIGQPGDEEFNRISASIKQIAGINLPLSDKNVMLVTSRLQRVLKLHGFKSYNELVDRMESSPALQRQFLCALTTNTTRFFRESDHFNFLVDHFQQLYEAKLKEGGKELRLWSTPCSTGQEPYSLSARLLSTGIPFKILATDIDEKAVSVARDGVYRGDSREEIPSEYLNKHFTYDSVNNSIIVTDLVKERVTFGLFNLLRDYQFKEPFDVIFCRNVLIYFDATDVDYVIRNLAGVLNPWGLLFFGHSEAGAVHIAGLKRVGPAVYVKETA